MTTIHAAKTVSRHVVLTAVVLLLSVLIGGQLSTAFAHVPEASPNALVDQKADKSVETDLHAVLCCGSASSAFSCAPIEVPAANVTQNHLLIMSILSFQDIDQWLRNRMLGPPPTPPPNV